MDKTNDHNIAISPSVFGRGGKKIERFFKLDAYLTTADVIEDETDASP